MGRLEVGGNVDGVDAAGVLLNGVDLSAVAGRAVRRDGGTYVLHGRKVFTAGLATRHLRAGNDTSRHVGLFGGPDGRCLLKKVFLIVDLSSLLPPFLGPLYKLSCVGYSLDSVSISSTSARSASYVGPSNHLCLSKVASYDRNCITQM